MSEITQKSEKENCIECKKDFLILQQEKNFYERKKLPVPVRCSACRREKRASLRNERKLYDRKCDKCGIELKSSYPSNSPYIVYCEQCYLQNVG